MKQIRSSMVYTQFKIEYHVKTQQLLSQFSSKCNKPSFFHRMKHSNRPFSFCKLHSFKLYTCHRLSSIIQLESTFTSVIAKFVSKCFNKNILIFSYFWSCILPQISQFSTPHFAAKCDKSKCFEAKHNLTIFLIL